MLITTCLRRGATAAGASCALAMLLAFAPPRAPAGRPSAIADGGTAAGEDPENQSDGASEDGEDGSATFGAELNLDSRFVWRGMAFSQGPVVQPSTWLSLWGFTLELWGNVMLNDEPGHDVLSAVVPALGYTWTWQRLSVEPGVVLYYTPNEPGPQLTTEATLELSYRLGFWRVLTETYIDIQSSPGAYFGTLGTEYEREVHDWTFKALLDFGWATAEFNKAYFGADTAAMNLIHARLSVRYDLTDLLYFALHADMSTLLHPALRRSVDEPTLGSGGASLGVEY